MLGRRLLKFEIKFVPMEEIIFIMIVYYDDKISGCLLYLIEICHYIKDNTEFKNSFFLLKRKNSDLKNLISTRYDNVNIIDNLDLFHKNLTFLTNNLNSLIMDYGNKLNGIILYLEHAGMDRDVFKTLKNNKNAFFNILKNVFVLKNDNVTKSSLIKTFFKNKTISFNHGIYDEYWKNKRRYYQKDYNQCQFGINSLFFYNSDLNGENSIEEKRLTNDCLDLLKSKNFFISQDMNPNPSLFYDSLIYAKYQDFCPRLPNEFFYYGKPVFLYNINRGISYYLKNPIERDFNYNEYTKMYIDVNRIESILSKKS